MAHPLLGRLAGLYDPLFGGVGLVIDSVIHFFFPLLLPATLIAIAMACFCGLPAPISVLMF